jgi:hypothetical protein
MKATRGVVLIDPFAGSTTMAKAPTLALPDLAEALAGAMIDQTRYATRDLLLAAYPDVYSRFMISALRDSDVGDAALATAGMGAFIGFASDAFRRHDYLLGRKNCQDFLRTQFVLPAASPVFDGVIGNVPPGVYGFTDATGSYMSLVPLVGSARVPETLDPWPKNALDPSIYRDAIEARFSRLLEKALSSGPLTSILAWLAAKVGEGKVADLAIQTMLDALKEQKLT